MGSRALRCNEFADEEDSGSHAARKFARFEVNALQSMQKCNFLQHHALGSHRKNAYKYFGFAPPPSVSALGAGAPGEGGFLKVWDHCAQGRSPSQGVAGVGKRHKVVNMIWALSEGLKNVEREFMRGCTMMSLRRDERKPWMGIRYSVAGPNMLSRQAFLGMERGFGTGATALTKATE